MAKLLTLQAVDGRHAGYRGERRETSPAAFRVRAATTKGMVAANPLCSTASQVADKFMILRTLVVTASASLPGEIMMGLRFVA